MGRGEVSSRFGVTFVKQYVGNSFSFNMRNGQDRYQVWVENSGDFHFVASRQRKALRFLLFDKGEVRREREPQALVGGAEEDLAQQK
jgi:hypothetical protein